MDRLLLINCISDDPYRQISSYLFEYWMEQVITGIRHKAKEINAAGIALLLPAGASYELPGDFHIYYGENSQVTVNTYAAVEVLKGRLPRPSQEELPIVFEHKEVVMITPEKAFHIATSQNSEAASKYLVIHHRNGIEHIPVQIGNRLLKVISQNNINLEGVKGILLDGLQGKFIHSGELTDQLVTEETPYGSLTFYYDENCMVEELAKLAGLIQNTSCGKCVLCREGSLQAMTILDEMTQGKAKMSDTLLLKEIGELIGIGAYCSFGQSYPELIESGFQKFHSEFEAHLKKKNCPVNVCSAYGSYVILPKQCIGCEDCLDSCPEDAIEGKAGYIHMIDEDLCEKCGKCVKACEAGAIVRVSARPKLPAKLTKVGKF